MVMELKGKKVLVVGLGRSGLSAALFLRSQGAQVTVSDIRSAEVLTEELPQLLEAGVMVEAGGHGLLTFRRQDLIVVSPGVPLETPELAQVQSFNLPVIGELELASRFLKGNILAITGSNGKTTTTSLVGEIMTATGVPTSVGGNIGRPVIDLIEESQPNGWSVLEVSSFQLETTSEFRPKVAVILNITPDHLDRHGTVAKYAMAKERIFAKQAGSDYVVLNADNPRAAEAAQRAPSQVYWFSRMKPIAVGCWLEDDWIVFRFREGGEVEKIMPVVSIPLKGKHNLENVLAAACATRLAGASAAVVRSAVEGFHAVEHRLEHVATIDGVEYYNDSKATNVDASIKAIESFPGSIHLILGGKDKNSDYSQMNELLRERVKTVYTIGSAAAKIAAHIHDTVPLIAAETLANAVAKAAEAAKPGDVILLAPACSSFDQFQNYEHRGRVFKELVMKRQGSRVWQSA
jgi:UDP-N-acetylmuramoylalanine--D-glutamate ligase